MNSLQLIGLIIAIAAVVTVLIGALVLWITNHIKGASITDWEDETR